MPSTRYGRPDPPEYTDPAGSAPTICTRVLGLEVAADAGDGAARADAGDEVRDPAGGLPPQISGPVVCSWANGFHSLPYWLGRKAPGVSATSRSATE